MVIKSRFCCKLLLKFQGSFCYDAWNAGISWITKYLSFENNRRISLGEKFTELRKNFFIPLRIRLSKFCKSWYTDVPPENQASFGLSDWLLLFRLSVWAFNTWRIRSEFRRRFGSQSIFGTSCGDVRWARELACGRWCWIHKIRV